MSDLPATARVVIVGGGVMGCRSGGRWGSTSNRSDRTADNGSFAMNAMRMEKGLGAREN